MFLLWYFEEICSFHIQSFDEIQVFSINPLMKFTFFEQSFVEISVSYSTFCWNLLILCNHLTMFKFFSVIIWQNSYFSAILWQNLNFFPRSLYEIWDLLCTLLIKLIFSATICQYSQLFYVYIFKLMNFFNFQKIWNRITLIFNCVQTVNETYTKLGNIFTSFVFKKKELQKQKLHFSFLKLFLQNS